MCIRSVLKMDGAALKKPAGRNLGTVIRFIKQEKSRTVSIHTETLKRTPS